jgi:hypothetical protein|tara:strand:- start:216 stop:446 length:231 start_codon:yes stop_codon:yes gene_type:complete
MQEKEQIQDHNFNKLISAKINPIQARFVAFKLAELGAEIQILEEVRNNKFKINTNISVYLVTLPNIPIPDAKIELM